MISRMIGAERFSYGQEHAGEMHAHREEEIEFGLLSLTA